MDDAHDMSSDTLYTMCAYTSFSYIYHKIRNVMRLHCFMYSISFGKLRYDKHNTS